VGAAAAASAAAPSAAAGAAVCAVGAAEAGVSSAHAAGMENVKRPSTTNRDSLVINANPPLVLDCVRVAFTRANTHDLREIEDEDLPVTDFAGFCGVDDCLDYLVGQGILNGDFNFCLGYELDRVLGTPIDFGVPALPPKATDFGDSDALHSHIPYGFTNIIKFERFDNCGN
jgi:hypothetical protein